MLIPVVVKNGLAKSEELVENSTFKDLGLKESDLEEFIRSNVELVVQDEEDEEDEGDGGETILVVGQQVANVERGRNDLVAIDDVGSLVLIELKRDEEDAAARKEPMEFQACRYAASLATIRTPDDLVNKMFAHYVERHKEEFGKGERTPKEMARRKLDDFLKQNNAEATFNRKQRIILIASSFDQQALSAVAWLIENKVDITVFQLNPKKVGDRVFLDLQRVLPTKPHSSFFQPYHDRLDPGRVGKGGGPKARLPKIRDLMKQGRITTGDILEIKGAENSEAEVRDDKTVNYQGQVMTYGKWGQTIKGWSAIRIYDWAVQKKSGKTLGQLRDEMIESDADRDDNQGPHLPPAPYPVE